MYSALDRAGQVLENDAPLPVWSLVPETLNELSTPASYVYLENIVAQCLDMPVFSKGILLEM